MRQLRLTIRIRCSPEVLFAFALNPQNTPRWIDFLAFEETNEWPVRLGTVYRNQNMQGEWREYEVTAFKPATMFEFSKRGSLYHVRYTITHLRSGVSELEYLEWIEKGELESPFNLSILQKLKSVIEADSRIKK